MSIIEQARRALRDRFTGTVDASGYVERPEDNLVPGIHFGRCAADLERGDGDELRTKFRAVHSSSALAVNSFGVFKNDGMLSTLVLDGVRAATCVEFEKPLRIFRGGRPANLDVWIERERDIVAVESKLLEYLTPKAPAFSDAYDRLAPPVSEPCWWTAYQRSRTCGRQLLDRAQLQKHYFGLGA
jgi:hypothetical protein